MTLYFCDTIYIGDGEMKCKKCKTENTHDAIYCKKCGSELVQDIHCHKCNKKLSDDEEYCVQCGIKRAIVISELTNDDWKIGIQTFLIIFGVIVFLILILAFSNQTWT